MAGVYKSETFFGVPGAPLIIMLSEHEPGPTTRSTTHLQGSHLLNVKELASALGANRAAAGSPLQWRLALHVDLDEHVLAGVQGTGGSDERRRCRERCGADALQRAGPPHPQHPQVQGRLSLRQGAHDSQQHSLSC